MMYAGAVPWHGLGTPLNKLATATEAIVAARLDWTVIKRPRVLVLRNDFAPAREYLALVRCDRGSVSDGAVLGYVDEDYTPLQNSEAFEALDPIVGQDAAVYETAGALGRGEQVWILARLPRDMRVAGDDLVAPYLLLVNHHGGPGGVQLRFAPVRVVCANTLTMALQLSSGVQLEHTPDLHARLQQAARNLDEIKRQYAGIERVFMSMARRQMNGTRLTAFLKAVFPDAPDVPKDAGQQAAAQQQVTKLRDTATRLFETGRGNDAPAVRGTLWAAYNGVTELADYYLESQSPDARLRSIWFGEAAELKMCAFDAAMALLCEKTPRWLAPERVCRSDADPFVGQASRQGSPRELKGQLMPV
jgi:phage/plasmid-like protein (TIGR03299 family)